MKDLNHFMSNNNLNNYQSYTSKESKSNKSLQTGVYTLKATDLADIKPNQNDYINPNSNLCCFVMYELFYQTGL
jgi:hypothetical protein